MTSKGAIDSATRALAWIWLPITFALICVTPGYIRTTRWDSLAEETITRRRSNSPGIEASYEDVANAVAFLASDEAKNITGADSLWMVGAALSCFLFTWIASLLPQK